MIQDPLALVAVIAAATGSAFWLHGRFRWASRMSATLLVIILGALLSNLGLVAAESPVYEMISGPLVSLAIVWLLLAVDLRAVRRAGPRMLGAFALAVGATISGALTASAIFGGALPGTVARLAGVMTGTYSGGGLNFVAVGRAVKLPTDLFAAATAADNVVTAIWIAMSLLLPVWLGRFYARVPPRGSAVGQTPSYDDPPEEGRPEAAAGEALTISFFAPVTIRPLDLALLTALAALLVVVSGWLAATTPQIPAVLWLTTLAVICAQLPRVRDLKGSMLLGGVALHLFFAVLGIASRLAEVLRVGPEIFLFTVTVVAVHGLLLYLAAWLLRFDVETTTVASQAAVGGPSTALAIALARKRYELALPGVVMGLLGYAVGNYAGVGVARLVAAWLG
ncbi:MAG: DUF819 domain-containing protein [Thermoanaerobaculia bacterium]